MAPYRAILRYYRCDTIAAIPHIARYFLREVSAPPNWCDTPPWHLVLHRHICAIPHFATYRAIIVRYPMKIRKNKSHPLARGLGWRSCGLPVVHQWIFSSRRHPRAPIGLWYRTPSSSRQLDFGVQQLKDSGSVGDQSLQVHTALT